MALFDVDWNPDKSGLRKFGLAVLIGFSLIGGLFYWRSESDWPVTPLWLWGIGIVVGGLGLTGTRAALPLYWVWMGIAVAIGSVTSRLMLALVFYGVVTPMGWLGWIVGRDRLRLRKDSNADSYWVPIKPPEKKPDYQRQF
jgi:hypothetical protein